MKRLIMAVVTISMVLLITITASATTPDIKANNSDSSITLGTSETLSITVSLSAGNNVGVNCDWWVAESTSDGWYYYNLITLWTSAGSSHTNLSPTYQGALSDLGSSSVLNTSGLSEGSHTFYFAVDTNMDGNLDLDQIFFDSVTVTIAADTSGSCTSETLWECFNETSYQTPEETGSPTDSYCKTWSTSGFTCSGTFYIAVYPAAGSTPTQFTLSTSCSSARVKTLTGAEIDNLLQTMSSTNLQNLSVYELEEGKIPVMLQVTFSGGGSGTVSVDVYCQ